MHHRQRGLKVISQSTSIQVKYCTMCISFNFILKDNYSLLSHIFVLLNIFAIAYSDIVLTKLISEILKHETIT